MESDLTEADPTMNRNMRTKNTFQNVFPIYAPQFSNYMSTTGYNHSLHVDYSENSEFSIHNKDIHDKLYNKKADRLVHYTEAMLKVKNMRAVKK